MSENHGRDDYHDPTRGLGGAAPARSALTLRLVLAAIGLVVCAGGAIAVMVGGGPAVGAVLLWVLAAVAAVDLVVVWRRKRRGEPG